MKGRRIIPRKAPKHPAGGQIASNHRDEKRQEGEEQETKGALFGTTGGLEIDFREGEEVDFCCGDDGVEVGDGVEDCD